MIFWEDFLTSAEIEWLAT